MGAWGTGLYQDDVADDIKHDYINKQKSGKSEETALKEVLEENAAVFEDDDDRYGAWLALADTMWKYGRLTEEVKRKALEMIEEEKNCMEERWQDKKDASKRMQVLENLRERLISSQPPKKRISVHKPFVLKWEKGDVYQYEITDMPENYPPGQKYKGWFVLIYVWDFVECEFTVRGVKDLLSIIYMKLSEYRINSPSDINDIQSWCNDGGLKYRFELLESSNRFMKRMEYVGKSSDFIYPEDEIVAAEKDYGIVSMAMFGVDAVKGYLCEKRERNRYGIVRYATGLSPREQIRYYENLEDIELKKSWQQRNRRKNENAGIAVTDGERIGGRDICTWEVGDIYRYKIENTPEGMEKYKGWHLMIYIYQKRGINTGKQGKVHVVPDIFVQVIDDKFDINNFYSYRDLQLLEYHMPFVCFSWDEKSGIGSYKAVMEETYADKILIEKVEKIDNKCWWNFLEREDEIPEKLNGDNIVEKALAGYEREFQRLGIDNGCSTLEVIKKYIEITGGIDRKLLEFEKDINKSNIMSLAMMMQMG